MTRLGAGQAFIALEDFPHLNSDIALLVGLAPAFFVHQPPPPHGWFIRDVLMKMSEKNLHKFFGEKGFLRPMLQEGIITYYIRYLFGWDDSIWEPGCRDSYFQFTPAQTSTKLVAHWMHNMKIGRIVRHRSGLVPLSDPSAHVPLLSVSSPLPSSSSKIVTPWAPRESHAELQPHHKLGRTNKSTSKVKCLNGEDHDDRNENENHGREEHEPKHEAVHAAEYEGEEGELIVGLEKVDCPVAIFHAMGDTVANGDRLASELMVNRRNKASGGAAGAVVHYGSLPGYGHMDVLWAHDATTVVFEPIVGLIRRFYN
ncbi:hypothetical protein Pelo_14882 [Pelomyxa schiedti]|nr:hypothetical protein Pelo_14882 [Pelomyxa schiedti]